SARVILHRAAALLWIFHTRPAATIVRTRIGVHLGDQLHGPDSWRLVRSSRNTHPHFSWHQLAAAVSDRFFLAERSYPQACAGRRLYLSFLFRDRRTGAHQPAGREPVGGGARLAGPVDSGNHLFHARGDVRVLLETEAGPWLRGR